MPEHNRTDEQVQLAQVVAVLKSVNLSSVLVSILLMAGMILDSHTITTSVLAGVGFYGTIASLLILSQPGALPAILISRQKEITLRRHHELPYRMELLTRRESGQNDPPRLADPLPLAFIPPADPPLPRTANFVSARPSPRVSQRVRAITAGWVAQLFDADTGQPTTALSPNVGQVQIKAPAPEVVEYLIALHMVEERRGNLYWNRLYYPDFDAALHAIRTGVRPPAPSGGYTGAGIESGGDEL